MDSTRFKFALPASLVVTTFLSASACKDASPEESSSEGTEVPEYCIDIEDVAVCDSEPGCAWDPQMDDCINICSTIEDEEECRSIERCEWNPLGGSETGEGGGGACEEPFT